MAPLIVSALLGVGIAAELIAIGLSIFQPSNYPEPQPPGSRRVEAKAAVDVSLIVKSHLFGVAASEAQSDVDAPATQGSLSLTATLAMPDPQRGLAILGANGQTAQVYPAGATVMDGTVLERVFTDYVILIRGGRREEVVMIDRTRAVRGGANRTQRPERPAPQAEELDDNSNSAVQMETFQLLPVFSDRKSGARIGMPKNPVQFATTGLMPGDILTSVNGAPVHGAQSAANMLKANGGRGLLTVRRGADLQDIQVDSL